MKKIILSCHPGRGARAPSGRIHKIFTKLLLCLLMIFSVSFAVGKNRVALLCKDHESFTRCTIDSRSPIHFQRINLKHPARMVLDINNAYWPHRDFLFKANSVLKGIRHSNKKSKALRFVFDLKARVTVQISKKNDSALILDFKHTVKAKKVKYYSTFQPKTGRDVIIVIDPGHGGKDPGASGPKGVHEKNIVLNIARALSRKINEHAGFKAVLTRRGDYYLTLRQRLAVSRKYHPDMFIAIHADAFPGQDAQGASVFALSLRGATSEAARWLAKHENASELMGGVDLGDKSNLLKSVLLNLSQTATIRASLRIGHRIIEALGDVGRLHHRKVEQAAFVVLKSPDIPSLLVETGFISNPQEERKLKSRLYQGRLAAAMMQGIQHYFVYWPPRGTTLAQQKFKKRILEQRYVVNPGDTLISIAEEHNISLSNLKKYNHIVGNQINAGRILLIPENFKKMLSF